MKKGNQDIRSAGTTGTAEPVADLYEILRKDHETIRGHFREIAACSTSALAERKELFFTLEQDLLSHLEAEERFFYTALEQHDALRPRVLVSYEEHQVVKLVIGAFTSLAGDDARWPAKLTVLRKLLERHVEEEEQELFMMSREVLREEQLAVVTSKVLELRREPKKPEATLRSG